MGERRKICFVIGTRPEAIKVWPVITHFASQPHFEVQTLLTGQHRELLDQMVELLKLPATRNLSVMTEDQSLDSLTGALVTRIGEALAELSPDCVIVQGDTTSVFTGALAAFYAQIPVGHLEAGLRSSNVRHPFPEEMNRRLVTQIADYHFAPTISARAALLADQVPPERIWVVGNSGIDALRLMTERLDEFPTDPRLAQVLAQRGRDRLIAVTVHRRENHPFMTDIARAFARILNEHHDVQIVFPVHLSPTVRASFGPVLGAHGRCHLLDPLDYASFVRLLNECHFVLTDSGGVQEEAPHLGKPVLVMRRTTERPEAVGAGTAWLIGETGDHIFEYAHELLSNASIYRQMARAGSPYGDGYTSQRVADVIQKELASGPATDAPFKPGELPG